MNNEKHTAGIYHECGHITCAYSVGAKLISLTADARTNIYEARLKHRGNWGHDPEKIKQMVKITLAGPAADMKFRGDYFYRKSYQEEINTLLEILKTGNRFELPKNKTVDDYWAEYSAPARIFCERNWSVISALAEVLSVKIDMNGEEVTQFFRKKEMIL